MAQKAKRTLDNPYGLTTKQRLAVEIMVKNAKAGKGLQPAKAHQLVYSTKRPSVQAYANMQRDYFRDALIAGLADAGLIGVKGKISQRLVEGIDAVKLTADGKKAPDLQTRLKYIQEINKIVGAYAPDRLETKRVSFNVSASKEDIEQKIQELQEELSDDVR